MTRAWRAIPRFFVAGVTCSASLLHADDVLDDVGDKADAGGEVDAVDGHDAIQELV